MQVQQTLLIQSSDNISEKQTRPINANLVLLFGGKNNLKDKGTIRKIKMCYPNARIVGCSTAGEIYGTQVLDDSLVVTAVQFEHTRLKLEKVNISDVENSYKAGERLAQSLPEEQLAHVFVLSDGLKINGSDLVRGLNENLPEKVNVTGGLSGDGERFQETLVLCDDQIECGGIIALGFYGDRLKIGYGSLGGWDPFGPERLITRAKDNVLYELDGKSALGLYKKYLGEQANGLPATGLLFPLSLRTKHGIYGVVRTILSINEEEQSMTFAGNVPEGWFARLMKANFDRLIDGAADATAAGYAAIANAKPDLAILISCVGRKMLLQQRIEEEVESVRNILGNETVITGFYSYGEISPLTQSSKCELNNQTMTVTIFSES